MHTLITGGGGFIGAWLAQRLHRAGISLRIFDSHAQRQRISELMGAGVMGSGLEFCLFSVDNSCGLLQLIVIHRKKAKLKT